MPKRYVTYIATASYVVEVDVPDNTPADEIDDVARDLAEEANARKGPGSLCHSCSGRYDLGDFFQDDSDDGVWGG